MWRKTLRTGIHFVVFGLLFFLPIVIARINDWRGSDTSDIDRIINSNFYSIVTGWAAWCIFVGIVVMIVSKFQKNKADRYRKYIRVVVNREIEDLDAVSKEMELSKSKVIRELGKMIDKRYLVGFDLNIRENKIYDVERAKLRKKEKAKNTRVVNCWGCGANNLIKERIGKCKYCGGYIE